MLNPPAHILAHNQTPDELLGGVVLKMEMRLGDVTLYLSCVSLPKCIDLPEPSFFHCKMHIKPNYGVARIK